jgi:hypothetical protein
MKNASTEAPAPASPPKEFSRGELIMGADLLMKIYDGEMAPMACVQDTDEAELLLRTIRPRMEVVQDDLEAVLDDAKAVEELIATCDQNCTCGYVDELLREHQVVISNKLRIKLNAKKSDKELSRCLNFAQTTFCNSELYKTLNTEKVDFTFEEGP